MTRGVTAQYKACWDVLSDMLRKKRVVDGADVRVSARVSQSTVLKVAREMEEAGSARVFSGYHGNMPYLHITRIGARNG